MSRLSDTHIASLILSESKASTTTAAEPLEHHSETYRVLEEVCRVRWSDLPEWPQVFPDDQGANETRRPALVRLAARAVRAIEELDAKGGGR